MLSKIGKPTRESGPFSTQMIHGVAFVWTKFPDQWPKMSVKVGRKAINQSTTDSSRIGNSADLQNKQKKNG